MEAELFGYERGAFTDAKESKPGLVEAAEGGFLFLDEIGDVDLSVQGKLLRAIEERTVRRVGSVRERKVDVRIVAATNRDLEREASRERFRRDLYFRLAVIVLVVPPLRERGDDAAPAHRNSSADGDAAADAPALPPPGVDLAQWEKAMIERAMHEAGGNQTKAAQRLGISRDTLRYRLKKFGLQH